MKPSCFTQQAPQGWPREFAGDLSELFFRLAVLTLFLGCSGYLVLLRVYVPDQWGRTFAPALGMVVAGWATVLVARGRAWLAVRVLAMGVWLLVTVPSFFLGGVHTPVVIAYPVLLLLMAWLFPASISRAMLALSILSVVAMGWGEAQGWLPAQPPTPTVLYVASQVLMLALTGIMASFAVGAYRRQLRAIKMQSEQAQAYSQELAEREQELAHALSRWEAIFVHNPQPVVICRMADGAITEINDAALRQFGFQREEVLHKSSVELGLWQRAQDRQDLVDALRLRGRCDDMETALCLRQGRTVVVSLSCAVTRIHGEMCVMTALSDITERSQLLLQLQTSQALLSRIIRALPDLVWLKDPQGVYMACNPRFEAFFGQNEAGIVGKTDYDFVDPAQADLFRENDRLAVAQGGSRSNEEWVCFASDGHTELLETTKTPLFTHDGALIGVLGVGHDITQRRQAQDALRLSASVFSHAREAIVITNAQGLMVDVNAAFTRTTGYERDGVVGKPLSILYSGRQGHMPHEGMWQSLCAQGHWEGEVWMRRRNGEVFAVLESAGAVRDPQGEIEHFVAMFSDITAQKRSHRRLERIAHYDALTNLPNRVLFSDRLQQAMAAATRHQRTMAVVFMDLDGFKEVNDRHGHAAGDQVLVSLAARMRQLVREGDTVARLGGDEFVAVLVDLVSMEATAPLLERLLAALAAEVAWHEGVRLQVSASMGVVYYPQTAAASPKKLLLLADAAMYRAKLAGKNRYVVADPTAPMASVSPDG